MADTIVVLHAPELSGLTGFKLELYALGSDTIANGAGGDDLTEATNRHGYFSATVTQALEGRYTAIIAESDGTGIGVFVVRLADDTNTYYLEEPSGGWLANTVWDEPSANHSTAGTLGLLISTIANRIGSFTGTGVNTIFGFFLALMKSDASVPSDVGGDWASSTDSTEAIRDRGDAAWTTATGFSVFNPGTDEVDIGAVKGIAVTGVDDFKADVSSLSTIATSVASILGKLTGITSLANWLRAGFRSDAANATALSEINSGGGGYAEGTDSQQAIADNAGGGGGSGGDGAFAVTITVVDEDDDPISGATVRLSEVGGAETFYLTTDSNGEAEFSVDAASYLVSITKSLFSFTPVNLVVSANVEQEYAMSTVAITTPSDPTLCTLRITCINAAGVAESGVTVSLGFVDPPEGDTGRAYNTTDRTDVSAVDGTVTFEVVRGAKYGVKRGSGSERWITIPTDSNLVEVNSFADDS